MKILMVAPQPFYAERGTPMNIRLMCRALGEAGHRVDLVVLPGGRDIPLAGVRILRVPNLLGVRSIPIGFSLRKLFFDLVMFPWLAHLCRKNSYDVIHGIEEGGFMAVLLGRKFGIASVFDMDSSLSGQLSSLAFVRRTFLAGWIARLEKKAMAGSDLVITVCSALTEKAARLAPGTPIVQIEDIPLQTDSEPDPENRQAAEECMRVHGILPGRYILYTGNLEQYQGIDLLLAAWKTALSGFSRRDRDLKLVIVGGPPARAEQYRNEADRQNLGGSVIFTGPRSAGEMASWMRHSALLVSPRSGGDNTPLKIYTYMAAGRPLLATNRRTHTQVLDDRVAFLAEPDAESFGTMIVSIFQEPGAAAEKAHRARRLVEERYTYDEFKRKLLEAYELLPGGRGS
jgi:glycosyltransferase involved in cell wall biosynthesis